MSNFEIRLAQSNPYLSNKQAARFLGLSHRTLEDWRLKGIGPQYKKLGKLVRYRMDDLVQHVEQDTFTNTGQSQRKSA